MSGRRWIVFLLIHLTMALGVLGSAEAMGLSGGWETLWVSGISGFFVPVSTHLFKLMVRRSAEDGRVKSMVKLGRMLEQEDRHEEAEQWFRRAERR